METLTELLDRQAGVVARHQVLLCAGESDATIRRRIRRREWATVHAGVYVDHTGPLTWLQRAWAAVLVAWPAALGRDSALRAADGPGKRHRRDDDPIHVVIGRKRRIVAPADVVVHRTDRLQATVQWNTSPPRVRVEHAVLDRVAAANELDTVAGLAQVVQSRRTTAPRIQQALDERTRFPRRGFISGVLEDIAAGTCSVLEHGYLAQVERAHGLPTAGRQVGSSSRGPIYRDVLYALYALIVELDGRVFHDGVAARTRDLDRDLDAAVDGATTVRLGWGQVFGTPCRTAERIGVLLQQRGWTGAMTPCAHCSARAA